MAGELLIAVFVSACSMAPQALSAAFPPQAHFLRHSEAANKGGRENLGRGKKPRTRYVRTQLFSGARLLFSRRMASQALSAAFLFDDARRKEKS